MPTAGWWEALFPDPVGIAKALGAAPGMTVIDLCSGDGWFTLPIAKVARKVYAVDIDPALHDIARARLSEAGVANVEYVTGDAFDLAKLVPSPVDLVFMANCFHGVPDGSRLARIVAGMLAPGGRFSILNWHKRPREETPVLGEPRGPKTELRLSPDQTTFAVEAGGLLLVEVVEVPPYHYGAIFSPGS
jgi:ubiquinone/menaquinone biosynthesis C-methylase UbiE